LKIAQQQRIGQHVSNKSWFYIAEIGTAYGNVQSAYSIEQGVAILWVLNVARTIISIG